ncbi:MAG: class I SAM-dependent methyltransferase [Hyphomicrobiaceae bacterium]
MTDSDDGTLAFYDANAADYAAYAAEKEDLAHFERFVEALPKGGAVCDLGSGSGFYAARLRDAGFEITAIDGSAGLATEAKRRYDIDVQVMRFEDFDFENVFDGVWAAWSLHHAPRAAFPDLLHRVGKAVRPGGVLFIAMKGGTGEARDTLDRLYAYHSMDELQQLVTDRIGGDFLIAETRDGKGFDGTPSPMHSLIVRKVV